MLLNMFEYVLPKILNLEPYIALISNTNGIRKWTNYKIYIPNVFFSITMKPLGKAKDSFSAMRELLYQGVVQKSFKIYTNFIKDFCLTFTLLQLSLLQGVDIACQAFAESENCKKLTELTILIYVV